MTDFQRTGIYADPAMDLAAAGYLPGPVGGSFCSRRSACTAGWFRYLAGLITMHGAALAAVLILGVSVWLAPSHKKVVIGVVFIGGCAVPLYLAWLTAAWGSFLAAVTAGAVTFVFPLRTLIGPSRLSCPIYPASPT